ncbi:MAG TPA: GNAT family N-acetyltransferase [Ruminococcus flavefaciens]|nr:GNAT family N-acetyltransferase [Ruminococcus flavefaciens]
MTETVIRKVDKDTELSKQLIDFVRNFSWDEVREHTLHVLENWEFTDWETPFAAISEGRIIGMVTVMKTDYYPLPEVYPWISTLFVSEEYRGKRISQKLIEAAEEYARASGFEKTYIPTEFVGLYEKYGYSYVRDIENYGGGVDRLYAKEI